MIFPGQTSGGFPIPWNLPLVPQVFCGLRDLLADLMPQHAFIQVLFYSLFSRLFGLLSCPMSRGRYSAYREGRSWAQAFLRASGIS